MYKNKSDSNENFPSKTSSSHLYKNRHRRIKPYCLPVDVSYSLKKNVTIINSNVLSPLKKRNSESFVNKDRVCRYEYCLTEDTSKKVNVTPSGETYSLKKENVADSNKNIRLSPSKISSLPFSNNWRRVPFCISEEETYTKKEVKYKNIFFK